MDREASAHDLLEHILLDESKDPTSFPIGLLECITNYFSNDQKIGSGGFADVYKGQLQSGIVAVKKLKQKSEMVETKFIQEVDSLMKVKHKNVVRFLGYCSDTQGKMWNLEGKNIMAEERQRFLCFEFLPQGSLDKHISDASSGLEWRTRYHIIKGICEGLHYLHGKKIVHSDLKPENILLDHNMVPKISDFGLARSFHEEQSQAITENVFGTLYYMAPEYYLRGVITFKSDIYSLGIIITEMLTGQKKDDLSIENVNENWTTRFKTSHGGTWLEHVRVCAEIGLDCMDFDPKKRPTIGHIIDRLAELEHKYGFIETNYPATHVLDVYPLDILFPFESDKVIKCPVTLTNKTDDLIGVLVAPTSIDAFSNPGYPNPFVWEHPEYMKDDHKSSIFRRLGPHSSLTIYMTLRMQEQPPLEAAYSKFEVVMVATKSEEDLKRLDEVRNTWRQDKSEDPLRGAKELGTVVLLATLRAAVTSEPARCQKEAAHKFIQATPDVDRDYICCMDVHPTKTWLLVAYPSHRISIWNYETQGGSMGGSLLGHYDGRRGLLTSMIWSIKFIAGEQWFAAGDGSGYVHVYAYTSPAEMDKVKEFKAHFGDDSAVTDLAVYPKHTLLLTASCHYKSIRLWDWSLGWTCTRVINTHDDVRGLSVGPRDASTFASTIIGSNDVVKVWDIHSPDAIATFKGRDFTFYTDNSHRDFLASLSGDPKTGTHVKIWDLQTKKHVHTLCSQKSPWNLRSFAGHPTLPILAGILETAGYNKVHRIVLWDVRTYRVLKMVEFLMEADFTPKMLFDGTEDVTRRSTQKLLSMHRGILKCISERRETMKRVTTGLSH